MSNRLNLPDEFETLIEKRELEHRRQADRERAAKKKNLLNLDAEQQETTEQLPAKVPVERRKNTGRRQED